MKIEVHNPPDYDARRMAAKYIQSRYGLSLLGFALEIEKEAATRKTQPAHDPQEAVNP